MYDMNLSQILVVGFYEWVVLSWIENHLGFYEIISEFLYKLNLAKTCNFNGFWLNKIFGLIMVWFWIELLVLELKGEVLMEVGVVRKKRKVEDDIFTLSLIKV